jgi:hypothetical protein
VSKGKEVVERCLNPAAKLVGRLRYWQKFLLIGLVLIAPLGYVVVSYLGVQSRDTSFAVKERVGVVYLRPATQLLTQLVGARALAVQVAAHKADPAALAGARSSVEQAVAQVDAASSAGGTLALNDQWSTLKTHIRSVLAAPPATPAKALADYDGLTTAVESLIAADGKWPRAT